MTPTWRDKFTVELLVFELDYEEAAQLSLVPVQCGAPHPKSFRHCNRPARHPGDHMVVNYRFGPEPGFRWPQETPE